ncbi:MAG: reverse transcriptase/maturase family protein [Candidatus Saccharimonadales bacterium]
MSDSLTTDYISVYRAWKNFRKSKRAGPAIDEFAYDLEANLAQLSAELSDGSYQHGGYQAVVLHEKKRRDLAVATVRDRVVHRLLYDYLVAIYDKKFDPDVWSCRKGKGLHACLARTRKLLQMHSKGYVWRADITKFYDNVGHATLRGCLQRKLGDDDKAMALMDEIISSFSKLERSHRGIPIGNLTSQTFSNIYLNELDRFIRHQIKPLAYVRYGDDFCIFWPTRRGARIVRQQAADFLANNLGLSLNPKNDVVVAAKRGLKFLGHNINRGHIAVDTHTTKSVIGKLNRRNAASYRTLLLTQVQKERMDWILLEKDVDV